MCKYLIDACVISGLLNTEDSHHDACVAFFQANEGERFCFSIHSFFEFKSSQARRLREGTFSPLPPISLNKHRLLFLDQDFYDSCVRNNLFEVFNQLKGADLIYACLARLHSITLVTLDKHFEQHANNLQLLNIGS